MDKKALERKLREIHKAIGLLVDEVHFDPLYKDPEDWESWGRLHAWAEAMSVDPEYILLIQDCCMVTSRGHLGDIA